MFKSILKNQTGCYFCKVDCPDEYLDKPHHVFFGRGKKKINDREGFVVKICRRHHRMVHDYSNGNMDLELKMLFQRLYEQTHTREEFTDLIGRNYL